MVTSVLSTIGSMPPRSLFTLWWSERWVRFLIIALSPVAVLDTTYTILLATQFGPKAEMNPVGRFMLENGSWMLWVAFSWIGFALLCMLTGSYYLAARKELGQPDTGFLSLIISLKVGMVGYNATFYHIESVGAGYPPLWIGALAVVISYLVLSRLLTLEHDLSWKRLRAQVQSRLDALRDARLVSTAKSTSDTTKTFESAAAESPMPRFLSRRETWTKRLGYLGLWVISVVLLFALLEAMLKASGLWDWTSRDFGWVSLEGPWFLAFFLIIVVFIGVSMMLIIKAFDVGEKPM